MRSTRRNPIGHRLATLAIIAMLGAALLFGGDRLDPSYSNTRLTSGQTTRIDVRVIDGDTLEISASGERIRLANIDAAETGARAACAAERRHGEAAAREARRLVRGAASIAVRRTGRTDSYGRTIAYIVIDGRDLGVTLMERGLARPWRDRRQPWCAADGALMP